HVRANPTGDHDLVCWNSRLDLDVAPEARLPMVQHPTCRSALTADVTMQIVGVPRQLRPLERERAESVFLRIVEHGSIERDDLAQGLSDCTEQRFTSEV